MPLPAPRRLRIAASPTTSTPDQDWFFADGECC
jgi:hypothetical protein